jgi:hypothetical protein
MLIATVAAILCATQVAFAACPANGNTHVLYATTNMGSNIASFSTSGEFLGYVIDPQSFPADYRVDKLRSIVHGPDGNLYVTSARGPYSKIFAVTGNGVMNGTLNRGCTRNFLFEVASIGPENPYMDHPYGMLFHPEDGSIFVGNQNTVTVTRYVRSHAGVKTAGIAPLNKHDNTPVWKVAPESRAIRDGMRLNVTIQANSGLFASINHLSYTMNSVRGIALSPLLPRRLVEGSNYDTMTVGDLETSPTRYYLLVCDVVSSAVLVFSAATGDFVFSLPVPSPIQVAFPHEAFRLFPSVAAQGQNPVRPTTSPISTNPLFIYVTSKDDGMLYKVPFRIGGEKRMIVLTKPETGKSLSGIYENAGHGVMYIADRNGRKISVFSTPHPSGSRKNTAGDVEVIEETDFVGNFQVGLSDQPEFLLMTQVELQNNLPRCYELNPDGQLRYTALCTAADVWLGVAVCIVVSWLLFSVRGWALHQLYGADAAKQRRISVFQALEEENERQELM